MVKEKRILSYFIGYVIIGLFICFIGLSNVFADELERIGYLSDITDVQVVVPYNDAPLTLERNGEYYLEEADNLLIYVNNYTFYKDVIYQLEIHLPNATLTNANTFTVTGFNSTNDNVSCRAIKIIEDELAFINFRWSCQENVDGLTFNIKNSNNENIISPGTFRWNYTYLLEVTSTTDNSDILNGLDDMEQSIVDSNKETQEVIKDQFNTCRDSYNLYDYVNNPFTGDYYNSDGTTNAENGQWKSTSGYISVTPNTSYTFSGTTDSWQFYIIGFDAEYNFVSRANFWPSNNPNGYTLTIPENVYYIKLQGHLSRFAPSVLMFNEGSSAKDYEPYGEEICSNKLDEAEETRKGIWETIKDLPNAFMNMLKGLFIPEDGYFEEWFNDLKTFIEEKLGFLATPFTIFIDFINRYLNLDSGADIIINIPDISVPNFEDHIIVQATSLNWSQLLKSKESLNTLWQLYLSFVDVFLILNFINLCENKYNRIFGGDTTQYEYYTVEESYTINDSTGEATNHRLNERKTTRKRVN